MEWLPYSIQNAEVWSQYDHIYETHYWILYCLGATHNPYTLPPYLVVCSNPWLLTPDGPHNIRQLPCAADRIIVSFYCGLEPRKSVIGRWMGGQPNAMPIKPVWMSFAGHPLPKWTCGHNEGHLVDSCMLISHDTLQDESFGEFFSCLLGLCLPCKTFAVPQCSVWYFLPHKEMFCCSALFMSDVFGGMM